MKLILSLLVFAVIGASSRAAEIIFSNRRDEDSFKRISEHLTGKENPGRYAIARTDPSQRNGYYVALKLDKKDQARNAASILIHFVRPGSQIIETKTIDIEPIEKKRALVGLTDGVWGSSDTTPTAWKIEILDTNGTTLSSSQSFLWSSVSS